MKRHRIPNLLSLGRLAGALLLPFVVDHPMLFLAIYAAAGVSDLLDGYLARRWNSTSLWGARLDSAADAVFFLVVTAVFVRLFAEFLQVHHGVLLAVVIVIRIVNAVFSLVKHGQIVAVHTWSNKATGLAAYLLPAVFFITADSRLLTAVLLLACAAAAEEFAITLLHDEPDPNRYWVGAR